MLSQPGTPSSLWRISSGSPTPPRRSCPRRLHGRASALAGPEAEGHWVLPGHARHARGGPVLSLLKNL